jgi:hypothetical protein
MSSPSAPTILITNGGPHSAETWAETTVSQIVTGTGAVALRASLLSLLTDVHAEVQERTRKGLPWTPALVDNTVEDICDEAADTPHAPHFELPETRDYLRRLLSEHFTTITDIERRWAADRANAKE